VFCIWFDDLEIKHKRAIIAQETHYDPWGLELVGIGRQGLNRFTFNGQSEKQANLADGKGYFYETDFRSYDATLGRFHAYDLMASGYSGITPYHFALNNPISANDPTGLEAKDWIANKKTGEITWDEKVKSKEDLAKSDKKDTHEHVGKTYTQVNEKTGETTYGDQYGNKHNSVPLPEITLSAKKPSVYDPAYHASTSPTSGEASVGYALIAPVIVVTLLPAAAAVTATSIINAAYCAGVWVGAKAVQFGNRVGSWFKRIKKVGAAKGGGAALRGVDDVIANPSLLEGKTLSEVQNILKNTSGWKEGVMTKTRSADKGWTMHQLNSKGTDVTDLYIQYHPGTHRHFNGNPYWKVSSGKNGVKSFEASK